MENEYEVSRADKLRVQLEEVLGRKKDVLSLYREWLDEKNIPAESFGCMTENVFSMDNIKNFLIDASLAPMTKKNKSITEKRHDLISLVHGISDVNKFHKLFDEIIEDVMYAQLNKNRIEIEHFLKSLRIKD